MEVNTKQWGGERERMSKLGQRDSEELGRQGRAAWLLLQRLAAPPLLHGSCQQAWINHYNWN